MNRITTREAAQKLNCNLPAAAITLRTANIPHVRCGRAYLWDALAVERLIEILKQQHSTAQQEVSV